MSAAEALDRIKADILAKDVCPELAKTATQLVFGDGDPNAEIVFIGEAPGKNEDLQGKPFVGAAGKFLNEMLESIGLERHDVYITNIVKYRPPDNRDPLPEEKQAFWPYLLQQITVIQPKIIIALGRHSGGAFIPDLRISRDHGQPKRIKCYLPMISGLADGQGADGAQGEAEKQTEPHKYTEKGASQASTKRSAAKHGSVTSSARKQDVLSLVILPLYHPAAALYNGGMRQTLFDDFARIPDILKLI